MPEDYNKLAEGIVKGSVPMVASFVERYVSDDETGFFVGDREHLEGDIRVHVTVFGLREQANTHLTDSIQLGVVDLQQLPDGRVWMVVGTLPLPAKSETEAWLSDLYSAMVRRMAARLVQFGFLDAPNRARLSIASPTLLAAGRTIAITQALKPPSPVTLPAKSAEPTWAEAQAARSDVARLPIHIKRVQGTAIAPSPNLFRPPSSIAQLDLALTIAMVFIWVAACGLLFFLLTLLI